MNKAEQLLKLLEAKVGDVLVLPKGTGYWDTGRYPIGGKFERADAPIEFEVTRIVKNYKGCDVTGEPTKKTIIKRTGEVLKKLACGSEHCEKK